MVPHVKGALFIVITAS